MGRPEVNNHQFQYLGESWLEYPAHFLWPNLKDLWRDRASLIPNIFKSTANIYYYLATS